MQRHYPDLRKDGYRQFSLQTRDKLVAGQKANGVTLQQDAMWRSLRSGAVKQSPETFKAALGLLEALEMKPGQHAEGVGASEIAQRVRKMGFQNPEYV